MKRTSSYAITGWKAVALAPFLIPLGLILTLLGFNKRTIERAPEDVAGFIADMIDGSGGEWDWDEFECVPITDPALDAIRLRAAVFGPPNANIAEAEAIAAARSA
ncbi:MAG TPA: hypothetical protein VKQ27_13615 [Acetobacteraceae bacterium]|nr:hypothetical protein [Acetobacteraceae bacterium]